MAAGLPVVATPVGGIPDLIQNGVNGFLVPPRAPRDLAKALADLCADPGLRLEFGERNSLLAGDHHIERYVEELLKIYAPPG
jgi:glycosyltransferase involved in cell wall biosynthesis